MTNPAKKLLNPKVLELMLTKTRLSKGISYKLRVSRQSEGEAEEVLRLRDMATQSLTGKTKLAMPQIH